MPAEQFYTAEDTLWGYWRIEEDESVLAVGLPSEKIPTLLTNPLKRLEFLAVRALVKELLNRWSIPFSGLTKDEFGKPFLKDSTIHVSLSHSYPYVAAILHRRKSVGIDLEQPKAKMLRIGPRVLAADELADAGENVVKHCIYWCAKETLIKVHGRKDLIFAKNLRLTPFSLAASGDLIGRIIADGRETTIPLVYIVTDNFVVVASN